jgi:GcrA cell cycle regulator
MDYDSQPAPPELTNTAPAPRPVRHGDSQSTAIWTPERTEHMKQLWKAGLSATQIANVMGGITRNAVIGKVHREGLSERVKPPILAAGNLQNASRKPPKAKQNRFNTGLKPMALPGSTGVRTAPQPTNLPADMQVALDETKRVTLMELQENMCRWPLGDPTHETFRFCGCHADNGASYCTHHARLAYQPGTRTTKTK